MGPQVQGGLGKARCRFCSGLGHSLGFGIGFGIVFSSWGVGMPPRMRKTMPMPMPKPRLRPRPLQNLHPAFPRPPLDLDPLYFALISCNFEVPHPHQRLPKTSQNQSLPKTSQKPAKNLTKNLVKNMAKSIVGILRFTGDLVIINVHFPKKRNIFIVMILGLMGITGSSQKPSVWCRGCPQGHFPPKKHLPRFCWGIQDTRNKKNVNISKHIHKFKKS